MAQTAQTKYKINTLAKDLNIKSKDLVDVLAENGITGKTSVGSLEDSELDLVFDYFTKTHELSDISKYFGMVDPEKLEAERKAALDAMSKDAASKAAAAKKEASRDAASKEAARKANEEKVAMEAKAAAEKEIAEKAASDAAKSAADEKATVEAKPTVEKAAIEASNAVKAEDNRKIKTGTDMKAPNTAFKKPFEKRPDFTPEARRNAPYEQHAQTSDRPFLRPNLNTNPNSNNNTNTNANANPNYTPRPFDPARRDAPQQTTGYQGKKFDRPGFDRPQFDRPQFDRQKNTQTYGHNDRGQKKPGGFMAGKDKDDDYSSSSVRQPSIRPIYDKDGRARSRYASERPATTQNEVKRPEGGVRNDANVRLVDMRSNEIDLSKYDERLDNLVPESVKDAGKEMQKIKKVMKHDVTSQKPGVSKGTGGRINRNEAAARDVSLQFGKGKNRKQQRFTPKPVEVVKKFTGPITLPEEIMISDLAAKLKITTGEVIKKLLMMGIGMEAVGANKFVDYDTAYLLADEMGITAEKEVVISIEDKLFTDIEDTAEELKPRSPVVVVMGHVDHGKTSLLDAIRHTNVTAGEAGGITQHIGAYRVKIKDKEITFLDTPGHEAFTAMRARGAQVTDIAILVVAADDGIMPQTVEAINHAKAAGVSIIVAINKMDKVGANPESIKQNLTTYDLVPEEWGGDTICVPVSALKHQGIEELLEMVLLVAEMKDLKANPNREARGIVIEAKLDKGRGPIATVLVQNGTLHSGDILIAGTATGRVRAMCDYKGRTVPEAGPSVPVEITGLSEIPEGGDEFRVVEDERMARELVGQRKEKQKEEEFKANSKVSLDDLFNQISEGAKELAIIVKADVQGSAEAVKASLEKLSNEEIHVKVIHSGVGGIKESDVMLADASNAIIVGFNVRPDKGAMDSAERQKVDIRTYRIIYECIDEITAAINGMLKPEFKEVVIGHAEVRQTIHVPGVGFVAGSYVLDGKILRSSQIRVVRDGIVIFEDKISSLRRFKDDVKEVNTGFECGIALDRFNDIKENDILEAYVMEEIKREI